MSSKARPFAKLALVALAASLLPAAVGLLPGDTTTSAETESGPIATVRSVTGHTVHAGAFTTAAAAHGSTPPHEAIPDHGPAAAESGEWTHRAMQRECVAWLNGMNLDQRGTDPFRDPGARRWHPSDEDGGDGAHQDHSFGRDVPDCRPYAQERTAQPGDETSLGLATDFAAITGMAAAAHVLAVEDGDCDPILAGTDFRYRGRLDFADPNGIYHEVQEYDYVCPGHDPSGAAAPLLAQQMKSIFPWTGVDPHNVDGCGAPGTSTGHKCHGTLQDLATERLWITKTHQRIGSGAGAYTYALQVDTCAGWNLYEENGKAALGGDAPYGPADFEDAHVAPEGTAATLHGYGYDTYYGHGLDAYLGGSPIDTCTDGSSFSLDDTTRGRVVHSGPPDLSGGGEAVLRGNAYDTQAGSDTFGTHRTNCRSTSIDWPASTYPSTPPSVGDDCYTEDHKVASFAVYTSNDDATHPLIALFHAHTNGRTGPDPYLGHGTPTGPGAPAAEPVA